MRISDWSSDVCSSDLITIPRLDVAVTVLSPDGEELKTVFLMDILAKPEYRRLLDHISWFNNHDFIHTNTIEYIDAEKAAVRSEEHTSALKSLMRISYAVFCLKKKIKS